LLIANFKYTGSDYEADMKKVGEDPETQRWWKITDVMQETLVDGAEGSGKEIPWWAVRDFLKFITESFDTVRIGDRGNIPI
jgi:L-rhamnose mutarotase